MKKILIILLAGFILLSAFGNAAAQEDEDCDDDNCTDDCSDCDDCETCRTNNFYYILIAGVVIFSVFFYLRNRAPKDSQKPPEKED